MSRLSSAVEEEDGPVVWAPTDIGHQPQAFEALEENSFGIRGDPVTLTTPGRAPNHGPSEE